MFSMHSDSLILVLGATDSGKSSLVRWFSEERNATENYHYPETRQIKVVSYHDGAVGKTVTVLEAPGFDHPDEDMTDEKIIELIGQHFCDNLGRRTDITAVIYVQHVGKALVLGGTTKKILKRVYEFCGPEACKNVIIATTSSEGRRDEQTSIIRHITSQGHLKQMLDAGAQLTRYDGSKTSARHLFPHLFRRVLRRICHFWCNT